MYLYENCIKGTVETSLFSLYNLTNKSLWSLLPFTSSDTSLDFFSSLTSYGVYYANLGQVDINKHLQGFACGKSFLSTSDTVHFGIRNWMKPEPLSLNAGFRK